MNNLFTTDEPPDAEKEDILTDIRPQINNLNLERKVRTCDTCNHPIRLSDTNAIGHIAFGTFTGWNGTPSSEIDGFYCSKHKPNPANLLESDDNIPTFRNKIVVVTVSEQQNSVTINEIDYADTNPL